MIRLFTTPLPSPTASNCYRPLLPLTVAFALGIAGRTVLPDREGWVLALLIASLVWTGWQFCTRRRSFAAPLLLYGALGYVALVPWLPSAYPRHHIVHSTDGARYRIVGMVEQTPQITPDKRLRLILRVEQQGRSGMMTPAAGKIRLTVYGDAPVIRAGDRLAFECRLRAIRGFRNPGGFDYPRYMAFQRIAATAWLQGMHLEILSRSAHSSPGLDRVRERYRQFITSELAGDARAVMQALTIGDRRAISSPLREVFNRLGIGHLLAISGLHVGIIAIVLMGMFKWIGHRFHFFLVTGTGHAAAVSATIPLIIGYGLVAGMAPSTQRAVIMVSLAMGAYLVRREGDTLNLVALAGLLILLWHPPVLFAAGFQMSFAAVLAIVLGLRHVWPATSVAHPRPGRRLLVFMAVTLYATAGTLPLLMYYFQQFSLIGLVANLVAVPLIGFVALPLGLLALSLLPLSAPLASLFLQLGGGVLEAVLAVGHWAARLEFAALRTFQPTELEIGGYYVLLAAVIAVRSRPRAKWLLAAAAALLMVDAGWWYHYRIAHRDLRLTVLDVGQGSAALLEFPGGETMLVDGGGYADNRVFDMGRRVIDPFLRRRKILTVDYLVLTHPSSDHMNGLVHVARHFNPRLLIWNQDRVASASATAFVDMIHERGLRVPPFDRLERQFNIGGAVVRILNPPHDYDRRRGERRRSLNNNSIVLQLTFEGCVILLPGDIERAAEADLLRKMAPILKSNVLLVPHHGSRSSSSAAFLEAVAPEFAILSCGWRNRFGFPHPEVLTRYKNMGTQVFRTDQNGAIEVRFRSDTLELRAANHFAVRRTGRP